MKTFVAILYLSFAGVLLVGQTLSRDEANPPVMNPVVDRLQRLSKTFPPEMPAATQDRVTVTPARSNCVYPSPATRSLSIKPCQATPHKLHVVPPFRNAAPKTKPATPPAHIR
jgi:hypothetical protein